MTAKGWHHDALSAFSSSGFSGSDLGSDLGPLNRVKDLAQTSSCEDARRRTRKADETHKAVSFERVGSHFSRQGEPMAKIVFHQQPVATERPTSHC